MTSDNMAIRGEAISVLPKLKIHKAISFSSLYEIIREETDKDIILNAINAIAKVTGLPRQEYLPLIDTLSELRNDTYLSNSATTAMGVLGFNVASEDKICEICERGQDHSARMSYCSEDHYIKDMQTTRGNNPQNW